MTRPPPAKMSIGKFVGLPGPLIACAMLGACAVSGAIQPAASSQSQFDGAAYNGQESIIARGTPGRDEYRIFHQSSTGFVSVQSVRDSAERRATEFCARKGEIMNPLRETASRPPYILGNWPRIEIIFECAPAVRR